MDCFHVTIRTSASPLSGTYGRVWICLIGSLCESPPVKVKHFLLPGSVRQSPILRRHHITQIKLSHLTVFTGLTVYKYNAVIRTEAHTQLFEEQYSLTL